MFNKFLWKILKKNHETAPLKIGYYCLFCKTIYSNYHYIRSRWDIRLIFFSAPRQKNVMAIWTNRYTKKDRNILFLAPFREEKIHRSLLNIFLYYKIIRSYYGQPQVYVLYMKCGANFWSLMYMLEWYMILNLELFYIANRNNLSNKFQLNWSLIFTTR